MKAQWKAIPEPFEHMEVSTEGAIRRIGSGKVLKLSKDRDGYLYCTIYIGGGRAGAARRKIRAHRAVLLAFCGPCPEGFEARHLNGIPDDNRLENLRWSSHDENIGDKFRHGTILSGERHPRSKLTKDQVACIRMMKKGELSGKARELGVNLSTVCDAFNGVTWRSVPC